MGFFSWKTADTHKSISNSFSSKPTFTVWLLQPNGKPIREENYDGYGVFGGHDVYALLAHWNAPELCTGNVEVDRLLGINIQYSEPQDGYPELKYPIKIVENKNLKYDDVSPSEDCEFQGYFYDEES
jgi:hypothetical protein